MNAPNAPHGTNTSNTTNAIRVLYVEDDEKLGRLTAKYLESHGLAVTVAPDGNDAAAIAGKGQFDVVLLDLMLPGKDGLEVCRDLRARTDTPIIMVTARGDEIDRVLGLEVGADDYVAKPFSSRELLARIKAQVRRARGNAGPARENVIVVGPLTLDPGSLTAKLRGVSLVLTAYEFALLRVFAERAGRVLTREQLLDLAKGSAEEAFDRSIDVRVSRLRQKLGDDPKHPRMLKTVRGAGYLLALDDEDKSEP